MTHEPSDPAKPPYVLLGTLDDKVIEFPFALGPSNLVSFEKVVVVNALLSPPIVIEEGHLLASPDVMSGRVDESIIVALLEAGLLKIMSRGGDLAGYCEQRRLNAHAAPAPGIESRRMVDRLQRACERHRSFLPYPPPSIDQFTFNRFVSLLHSSSLETISGAFEFDELNAFEDRFREAYKYGNQGGQWTSRSAWEHAAKLTFTERPAIVRVLMSIANRERHILRAAGLARALGRDVIVETGFDFGESPFTTSATPLVDEVRLRSRARRNFFEQVSLEDAIRVYPALFDALSDSTSSLALKKAKWLTVSAQTEQAAGQDEFLDVTREYLDEIGRYTTKNSIQSPTATVNAGDGALFNAAYGLLVPASLNFLLAENSKKMSRREAISALIAGGAAVGLYQLRPWGSRDRASSRSRLIAAQSRGTAIEKEIDASGVFQDNFHERLVVSHIKASSGMQLQLSG